MTILINHHWSTFAYNARSFGRAHSAIDSLCRQKIEHETIFVLSHSLAFAKLSTVWARLFNRSRLCRGVSFVSWPANSRQRAQHTRETVHFYFVSLAISLCLEILRWFGEVCRRREKRRERKTDLRNANNGRRLAGRTFSIRTKPNCRTWNERRRRRKLERIENEQTRQPNRREKIDWRTMFAAPTVSATEVSASSCPCADERVSVCESARANATNETIERPHRFRYFSFSFLFRRATNTSIDREREKESSSISFLSLANFPNATKK